MQNTKLNRLGVSAFISNIVARNASSFKLGALLATVLVSSIIFGCKGDGVQESEGTIASPVKLVLSESPMVFNGTVGDVSSYYSVTGLDAAKFYGVGLAIFSENLDLYVYSDASFETIACLDKGENIIKGCAIQGNVAVAYIEVKPVGYVDGTTFKLSVSEENLPDSQ